MTSRRPIRDRALPAASCVARFLGATKLADHLLLIAIFGRKQVSASGPRSTEFISVEDARSRFGLERPEDRASARSSEAILIPRVYRRRQRGVL